MIVLRLSLANLKKKKSMAATLLLMVMLATLFLDMGLSRIVEEETAFSNGAERLNSPDFICVTAGEKYDTAFEEFLQKDARVGYVEKEDIIYVEQTENSANTLQAGAILYNMDREREIEKLNLFSKDSSIPTEKAIYLPKSFEGEGVTLGDEFVLTIKNIEYHFLVAGFFETSYMGTTGYALLKYFVPEERFQELYESVGVGKSLSAVMKKELSKEETSSLKADFMESTDYYAKIGGLMAIATSYSYLEMKESSMSLLGVPIAISMAIAFMIGVITILVVFLKVKEGIEENMINIGSLLAMGYTSAQIMLSQIIEYAVLGLAGGILGILGSYLVLPFMTSFGEDITGIMIAPQNPISINLISMATVLLLMIGSAAIAARKIKKIPPVTALRRGVQTHHYGRNFFPLKKGSGSIHYHLALKNMCGNVSQSITTILVVLLGVFSISVAVVLFANFGVDSSGIVKMTGMEIADVQVKTMPHIEVASLQKELEEREEVSKTNCTEIYMAKVGTDDVQFLVSNDFDKTETLTIVEGEFPLYDNEVVLTASLLKKYHKNIGDTIPIKSQGITKEFIVVGKSAGTNNGGKMGILNLEGIWRMNPSYQISQIDIYLKNPEIQKEFMEQLYEKYGWSDKAEVEEKSPYGVAKQKAGAQIQKLLEKHGINSIEYAVMLDGEMILSGNSSAYQIKEISSLSTYLDGQLKSYTLMMSGLMAMILIVMLLVMGAIISISIKSLIQKQKESFGIYKALGYTTKDIMKIIQLNFVVNTTVGALLGTVLCRLTVNPILRTFFQSMGLDIASFRIHILWLVGIAVFVIGYVWLLSLIRIYQVRRITVYELLTE